MGLGYSVEQLGTIMVGKEDKHIVTEGLAVAVCYIAARYIYVSVTRGKNGNTSK